MKKIILCFVMLCTFSLTGCFTNSAEDVKKVYFVVNNEELLTLEYDNDFALPYAPELLGHKFEGWYLDKYYNVLATVENLKNNFKKDEIRLYAKYSANIYDYKVNFISENKIYATSEFKSNEKITMPKLPKTDNRYEKFEGWYFDLELTDLFSYAKLYELVEECHTLNLYAKFEETDYYVAIDYFIDGQLYKEQEYHTSKVYNCVDEPEGTYGQVFEDWYIDQEQTIKFDSKKIKDYTTDTETLKLYGKFIEENKYTINFDADIESISWYESESIYELPTISKENYEFLGWTYNGEIVDVYNILSYFNDEIEITLSPSFRKLN